MPAILTERIIEEATQIAVGLHHGFTAVLQLPIVSGQRASVVARKLGVGRMTCQRIMKLGGDLKPTPDLLAEVPGVNGLRHFLSAMEKVGTLADELAVAVAAVDAFSKFLDDVGLSQTKLASALSLYFDATDPERLCARRENLFDAAATITGQSADATISMMAIRMSDQTEFNFEQIAVRGYSQMRATGSAMPIRLPINMLYSDYRHVSSVEAAREPQELIEAFCSRPLPSIDARMIKEEHLAHLINPEHIPTGEPFDCFATQHTKWNVSNPGMNKVIWLYIDYPTRHCTLDLYLHRDIEERHALSGDCHLWGTSLLAPPEDLWMTRFSDPLEFSELGPGTTNAGSAYYGRHGELAQYMFEHHDWDADEFVCFRCEMELPVWRSGICLVLDER
jgi:hypothetical protein